jgi:hypothetical protein
MMGHPCLEESAWMIVPSSVSTPFCLILVVWWWILELLLFVSTPFSWVVWEQPLAFLLFALGCSYLALASFYFICFS